MVVVHLDNKLFFTISIFYTFIKLSIIARWKVLSIFKNNTSNCDLVALKQLQNQVLLFPLET